VRIYVLTEHTDYEGETVTGVTQSAAIANEWLAAPPNPKTCADMNLVHLYDLLEDGKSEFVATCDGSRV
jgi:hypothetical protein